HRLVPANLSFHGLVCADDLLEGNTADPKRHPIAIALRRQDDVDDARVTKNETLIRRGKQWFRYDAPNKRLLRSYRRYWPRLTDESGSELSGRWAMPTSLPPSRNGSAAAFKRSLALTVSLIIGAYIFLFAILLAAPLVFLLAH